MNSIYHDCYTKVYQYKGRWQLCRQKNGVRKTFYSSLPGNRGRKECAEKAAAWLVSDEIVSDRTTVAQMYEEFLDFEEKDIADIRNLRSRYRNHIEPIIGRKKINRLTRQDLQNVITNAHDSKKLSKKTLMNLRGDLSLFCGYLDDSNIRHDLSTKRVKIPKSARRSEKECLTAREIALLFTQNTTMYRHREIEDYYIYAYRFQILYGLRPGELMGLEWGDIEEDTITINRAINDENICTAGKNEYAHRVLPMTPLARQLLAEQERKYRSNKNDPSERIFGDYQPVCYRNRLHAYCEYNGLCDGKHDVTPYELRHTFASVNKYLPSKALDTIMGHVSLSLSLGTYSHWMDGDMDGIGQMIDDNLMQQIERGKRELASQA